MRMTWTCNTASRLAGLGCKELLFFVPFLELKRGDILRGKLKSCSVSQFSVDANRR
jgi:uncharacterized Fe-S cluster-containing protein